jgi:hypothetical protein
MFMLVIVNYRLLMHSINILNIVLLIQLVSFVVFFLFYTAALLLRKKVYIAPEVLYVKCDRSPGSKQFQFRGATSAVLV